MSLGSSAPLAEQPLAYVFLALQLTGCGIFLFMVLTALSFRSSVKRHPIWYSFCISFIVFTLSYSLLVLSQERDDPIELVKTGICVGQAALVYAAPCLAPSASAALLAMLLFKILAAVASLSIKRSAILLGFALAGPWLLWVGFLVGATVFILHDTSMVILSPNGTYCVIDRPVLPRVSASVAAIFSLVILFLEIGIAYRVYKHRRQGLTALRNSIPMVIRIAVLSAVALGAVLIGVMNAGLPDYQPSLDIMIAMVPFVTSFTFATQHDLWMSYIFWKKPQADGRHRESCIASRHSSHPEWSERSGDLEMVTVNSMIETGPDSAQRNHASFVHTR